MKDTLQRFLFQNTCVRGQIIRLDDTLKTILLQDEYPLEIRTLLSQTLSATTLLSAILKYDGQLTVQFQSEGPLTMLVAKCDDAYRVRGTARFDKESPQGQFLADFEEGQLVITIQNNKSNQRYQSIVKINHQSIAASLENYFIQSEQLETKFWLVYDDLTQRAVGLLLQKLPNTADTTHEWEHIVTLANTITNRELLSWNNETILSNLFHEETIQLFEPHSVAFFCPCNADKMLEAIRLLGEDEAFQILRTHRFIEVACEYCSNQFEFNESEVKRLFTKH